MSREVRGATHVSADLAFLDLAEEELLGDDAAALAELAGPVGGCADDAASAAG